MLIHCYRSHCYWNLPPLSALITRLPTRSSFTAQATAGVRTTIGCFRQMPTVCVVVIGAKLRCLGSAAAATNAAAIGTAC